MTSLACIPSPVAVTVRGRDREDDRDSYTGDSDTVGRGLSVGGDDDPKLTGADGIFYVRSDRPGFGWLWRFTSLTAQPLDVWVEVSADDGQADRAEAVPL